ncbi:hypothetical protein [Streptomyces sp. NPDC056670]|uniref:hypothetical protein n=1 Tax=Streptomyces sp. NPDC056670 TaxID=3345904 RepID=UPI0036C62EFF
MTKPERSVPEQPLADQLVSGQDVPGRTVPDQPVAGRGDSGRTVSDQPLTGRDVPDRTAADRPSTAEEGSGREVPDQSSTGRGAPDQPLIDHSVTGKHLTGQPVSERPVSEERLTAQPPAEGRVPEQAGRRPGAESGAVGHDDAVLPPHEREKLQLKLQHAVGGFVDEPRSAVEEAASAVDALTEQIIETLGQRRGALRASWQDASGGSATEDLRMALREYRRLAERLLSL